MNYTTQVILSLAIIFIFCWNRWTNYYAPKWYALSILVALFASVQILTISNNYFLAITYAYILIWSLWVGFSQMNRINLMVNGQIHLPVQIEYCRTTIAILITGCLFIFSTKTLIDAMYMALPFIIVGSAVHPYLPIKYRLFKNQRGVMVGIRGAGANISVDCSLTSVMTILVLCSDMNPYIRYVCLVVGFASILKTRASSGLFGLALGTSIYLIATFGLWALIALVPVGIFAVLRYKNKLFALSGRAEIWKNTLLLTKKQNKLIFGFGPGSYKTIHPCLYPQMIKGKNYGFIWSHSMIQNIFETGIIGFALIIISIISISINCSALEIAVIACCVVNMSTNFIDHLAPEVMMMTLFIKKHYLIN